MTSAGGVQCHYEASGPASDRKLGFLTALLPISQ